AEVRELVIPLDSDFADVGVGKPGTALEHINLKTAALQTFDILEEKVMEKYSNLKKGVKTPREYLLQLVNLGLIDRGVGMLFMQKWERIRYGARECNTEDYKQIA
ncbi:hypothetical protein HK096_008359, partial [Nowakowskiella sp. JEL0078]